MLHAYSDSSSGSTLCFPEACQCPAMASRLLKKRLQNERLYGESK